MAYLSRMAPTSTTVLNTMENLNQQLMRLGRLVEKSVLVLEAYMAQEGIYLDFLHMDYLQTITPKLTEIHAMVQGIHHTKT